MGQDHLSVVLAEEVIAGKHRPQGLQGLCLLGNWTCLVQTGCDSADDVELVKGLDYSLVVMGLSLTTPDHCKILNDLKPIDGPQVEGLLCKKQLLELRHAQ